MEGPIEEVNPYKKITFLDDEGNFKDSGWYTGEHDIPYNIYYHLNCGDDSLVTRRRPCYMRITPNLGGGVSLSIWMHKSVPEKFRDLVFFHELKEAEFVYRDRLSVSRGHKLAVQEEEKYLSANFTPEEIEEFKVWESTLSGDRSKKKS